MPEKDTFFQKLTSINFTVKNLSTVRCIHIFNYPIEPGQTRDLLAIPEISEGDIRHSLIKGELANFIRFGVIDIISSSIDLTQYDGEQQQFVNNAGISSAEVIGSIIFGGGESGSGVFDGVRTHQCAQLVGTTYTLLRDAFLSDGTIIYPGITIYTAGYRLFCNGTLTNNGTIHNNGKNASGATGGASSSLGSLGIGVSGGNGGTNAIGSNGTAQSNGFYGVNAIGGGGAPGGSNAGGNGGTYTTVSSGNGGAHWLLPMISGFLFGQSSGGNQAQLQIIGGGSGGGGGGSDNASATGGGGGGGGGVLILHALNLINNGIISANGGNGGNATGTAGNAGGGGGGGGGVILNISRFRSGTGSFTVNGGSAGQGYGNSTAGVAGNAGDINLHSV